MGFVAALCGVWFVGNDEFSPLAVKNVKSTH